MPVAAVARPSHILAAELVEGMLLCRPTITSRSLRVGATTKGWSCLPQIQGCRRAAPHMLSITTKTKVECEMDSIAPSSVRQANKLLRRHLLRAQTSRTKAAGLCLHKDCANPIVPSSICCDMKRTILMGCSASPIIASVVMTPIMTTKVRGGEW